MTRTPPNRRYTFSWSFIFFHIFINSKSFLTCLIHHLSTAISSCPLPAQKSEASSKTAYSYSYSNIPTCLHSLSQMPAPEHSDLRPRGASARVCGGSVAAPLRVGPTGGEVHVAGGLRGVQPRSLHPRHGEYTLGVEN